MFSDWMTYKGSQLTRDAGHDTYRFVTDDMRIDADGAPNAYHPDPDTGLDDSRNAGYGIPRKEWWRSVLVPDPDDPDNAYVQKSGPNAGFFVSQTALNDPSVPAIDPKRYVDASTIPYLVFPGSFATLEGTGRLGDFGVAVHLASRLVSPFIVADIGPRDHPLGEVSIALAEALGGRNVSPRNGAGKPKGDVAYIVFRFSSASQSGKRWPLSVDQIAAEVDSHIARVGGLATCLAGL